MIPGRSRQRLRATAYPAGSQRLRGRIVGTNGALPIAKRIAKTGKPMGSPVPERVVGAKLRAAMLTKVMDSSPQLALGTGYQVKGASKAGQDRKQRPQFQPIQQQTNRFKAHFPPLSDWGTPGRASLLGADAPWSRSHLAGVDFNQMPVNPPTEPTSRKRLAGRLYPAPKVLDLKGGASRAAAVGRGDEPSSPSS